MNTEDNIVDQATERNIKCCPNCLTPIAKRPVGRPKSNKIKEIPEQTEPKRKPGRPRTRDPLKLPEYQKKYAEDFKARKRAEMEQAPKQ